MRLETLVIIAKAYADLGDAVSDQVDALILERDSDPEEYNPNALDVIRKDFLAVVERIAKDEDDEDLLGDLDVVRSDLIALYDAMED